MKRPLFVLAALLSTGGLARAHVGGSVAVARFTHPADPMVTHGEPRDTVAPFTLATADQTFTISWEDGDSDPTGRFIFYWMDHAPTFQVTIDDVTKGGLAHLIEDPINQATGYYASCTCNMDLGVDCPPGSRDPKGNCANQFVWNTAKLPKGSYWIIAVNDDPPFHVYNAAGAPVAIAHGGETPPPAAIVVRPDGIGLARTSYRLQWLAFGKPPLRFDLSYGIEEPGRASQPVGPIAMPAAATQQADGSYDYEWDLSSLPDNTAYFVRLQVTDGDGVQTFTDSHFGIKVFRSAPADMAMAPARRGCDLSPGAVSGGGAAVLTLLLVARYLARVRRG